MVIVLKKLSIKKNGFTLVEMIAAITILAFIFLFIVPNIDKLMNRNTEKLYNIKMEELKKATELYLNNHYDRFDYSTNFETSVELETLYNEGLILDYPVDNPKSKTDLTGKMNVKYCAKITSVCTSINKFIIEYE